MTDNLKKLTICALMTGFNACGVLVLFIAAMLVKSPWFNLLPLFGFVAVYVGLELVKHYGVLLIRGDTSEWDVQRVQE